MKKYFALALITALTATGVFALNVGGGILFNNVTATTWDNELKINDFGLYGFVGWKYVDIDAGLTFRKYSFDYFNKNGGNDTFFMIGLNFKLPIKVTNFFRFYPIVGAYVGFSDYFNDGLAAGGASGGLGFDVLLFRNMYAYLIGQYNYNLWNYGGSFLLRLGLGWML